MIQRTNKAEIFRKFDLEKDFGKKKWKMVQNQRHFVHFYDYMNE